MKIIISDTQYKMLFEENIQKIKFSVKENKRGSMVLFLNVNGTVKMYVLATKMDKSDIFLNNFDTTNDIFSKIFMDNIINYFVDNNIKKIWVKAKANDINFLEKYGFVKRPLNFTGEDELYNYTWMYKELS